MDRAASNAKPTAGPTRISLLTYNIWNTDHLEARTSALQDFFTKFDADIICLQEVRPETLALLDTFLPSHSRIHDKNDAEPGWNREGNIYFNNKLLHLREYGALDIGMKTREFMRRVFWAVLEVKATGQSIFVSTAHFTWEGHADECETGASPRVDYTWRVLQFLQENHNRVDAVVFCGDLNDRYHPRRILKANGYMDTYSRLGLPIRTTWPTPSWRWTEDPQGGSDFCCDFAFTCSRVKVLSALVVEHSFKGIFPSDHFPVLNLLQLPAPGPSKQLHDRSDATGKAEDPAEDSSESATKRLKLN